MFAVRYPIVLADSLHRMTMWAFIEVLIITSSLLVV